MMDFPQSEFWDYSIELYADEGVAGACLGLQQRHAVDVNLVLFCLWAGASGRDALGAARLERAMAAVAVWHEEVVRHLRKLRRRLKGGLNPAPGDLAQALRHAVAAIEIDAEHVEQLMLAATLEGPATGATEISRAGAAADNLWAYLAALGVEPEAADRADAAVLLAAAFPTVAAHVLAALGRVEPAGA